MWKSSGLTVLPGSASVRTSCAGFQPPQSLQQATARLQRRASLLVREGDRHLGQVGEGGEELELVLGQVVEAVEEDRALAPEGAVAAQLGDRLAGDAVGVAAAGPPPHLLVAAVEGGEVAEVGGAFEGRGARPRPPPARPRPPAARRSAAPARRRSAGGRRSGAAGRAGRGAPRIATAIARSRCAAESSAPGGAPAAVATVRNSAPKVIAAPPSRAPSAQSSRSNQKTSSTVGTTRIGSRSRVAANSRRTSPARPELGGPWISFRGTRPSLRTAPAPPGGHLAPPRKLGE